MARTKKTVTVEDPQEKIMPATGEPLFTQSDVQEMIAKAVSDALANAKAAAPAPQNDTVTVLYLDEVAQNSALNLGDYGQLRPHSYLDIPKREFGNKFMGIPIVRRFVDNRRLLVMSGLTQEERERWNCDYKPGEVLDERTFDKFLDYSTPELAGIFKHLCPEHQRFVAIRMITAKEKGDNRISLEKVRTINELSKQNDPDGMLRTVLEAFSQEIKS